MVKRLIKGVFKIIGPWYIKMQQLNYVYHGIFLSLCFRTSFAHCGKNFRANGYPIIHDPQLIHVGDNFTINSGAQLCPRGMIYIGNNVTMSRGSQITAGGFNTSDWKNLRLKQIVPHMEGDVFIGDGTWLCINAIVLPGVRITGKGVIVAAGAVVVNDITDDFVVVGGIPAKIIKRF